MGAGKGSGRNKIKNPGQRKPGSMSFCVESRYLGNR